MTTLTYISRQWWREHLYIKRVYNGATVSVESLCNENVYSENAVNALGVYFGPYILPPLNIIEQ